MIWKTLFLSAVVVLFLGCAHGSHDLHGKLWQGNPAQDEIWRKEDARALKCSDLDFHAYTCLKTEDLKAYGQSCREFY